MGFTSFLHLAGFLSFPIRLKALDLGRSNRTGNFRPKYAPLKNFCWRIHRNPLFWDIGLSTTFFFRIFFAVKLWPEKTKGETKTADFLVLKDSTLSSSPVPILRLFDSGSAWRRPVTAGVCGDMLEGGAGVATDGTDETSPFCSSTLKGGSQIGTLGHPQMSSCWWSPMSHQWEWVRRMGCFQASCGSLGLFPT